MRAMRGRACPICNIDPERKTGATEKAFHHFHEICGCVICSVDRGDLFLVSRKRCVGNISENDGVGCKGKGPTDFGDGGRNTH